MLIISMRIDSWEGGDECFLARTRNMLLSSIILFLRKTHKLSLRAQFYASLIKRLLKPMKDVENSTRPHQNNKISGITRVDAGFGGFLHIMI